MLETVMNFIMTNIAYILLAAAVLYFAWFGYSIYRAKKHGEGFRFHLKTFIPFALILGLAVYCLASGQDLSSFIS